MDALAQNTEITLSLKNYINENDIKGLRQFVSNKNIVDIAIAAGELKLTECLYLIRSLTTEDATDLFDNLDPERQEEIIEQFSDDEIKKTLGPFYASEIVDIIDELPHNIVHRLLKFVDPKKRHEINQILNYPEDSVGSYMNINFVTLKADDSIFTALKKIKAEPDICETLNTYYVVDDRNNLIGQVDLKKLFFAKKNTIKIKNVMEENHAFAYALDDRSVAAKLFQKYEIHDLPVINQQNKLIGVITYEDVLDILEEETTEDYQHLAGIEPIDNTYLSTKSWTLSKSRIKWLTLLMLSATLSQMVLQIFQNVFIHNHVMNQIDPILKDSIFTAILIPVLPVISGTAGNAGTQSTTVIIRALALDEINAKDYWKITFKEWKASLFVGSLLVIANFFRMVIYYSILFAPHHSEMTAQNSWLWITFPAWKSILATSISLMIIVSLVKFVGASLPILATKFHLDPAVMAAPLLTTLTDAISTSIFFTISFTIFLIIPTIT